IQRLTVAPDQERQIVFVLAGYVHEHPATPLGRFGQSIEAHADQKLIDEIRRGVGLLLQGLLLELGGPSSHHHQSRTGARVAQHFDLSLLLTDAELIEGGLDGLLNRWGALLDLSFHADLSAADPWVYLLGSV